MDIKYYLSLFLRRLPWFLLVLFIGSAAGLTLATVLPPAYVARSTLIVESEQIPSDLAETTVRTGTGEALQIIQQRILTRNRLIEMANTLEIYAPPDGGPRPRMSADDVVRDLRKRISIESTGSRAGVQATIVSVSFEAPTAQLAATVVNEIVTALLQENVEIRTGVAGQTLEFFESEVERLDRELTARGAEILAFQEEHMDALPDSLDFRRSQLAAAQERLTQMERAEATLRDRRDRLVALYQDTGEVAPMDPGALSAEERQLQNLQDQLASALAVLSPQNPRVQLMQSRIAALEARVAQNPEPESGAEEVVDPQLTAYNLQLADIDGQLEFVAEQKLQIDTLMQGLQDSIAATPANTVELTGMQRDYDAVRQQYDQAVRSRARAVTGDTIEAMSKGQRITVVEPAVPPQKPERPNRMLIAAMGIGGGLLGGAGIVILFEVLNSAVRRPEDLIDKLGITPFATLPYIRTRQQILRRRLIIAGTYAVVLIGLPSGLWWLHTHVAPLDLLMDQAIDRLKRAVA